MTQNRLARWLKTVIIGLALCGVALYALAIPEVGKGIIESAPEFAGWYWPWLVFSWVTAVPCYAVLVLGWRIASNVGKGRSFSMENARLLRDVAILAALDGAIVLAWDVIAFFTGMNHPGVALALLLVVFVGASVSVAAACLSHLVRKAADLQEQSDLTI